MKHYYGFQFYSGRKTTTGEPGLRGYCSIAGSLVKFDSKSELDHWISNGKITSDMQGNCRQRVLRKDIYKLCRGDSAESLIEFFEE